MLKLTQQNGTPVYISPVHICALCHFSSGNTDVRFAGGSYLVRETPEQIMAMPEMLYFLNPAIVLNGGTEIGMDLSPVFKR